MFQRVPFIPSHRDHAVNPWRLSLDTEIGSLKGRTLRKSFRSCLQLSIWMVFLSETLAVHRLVVPCRKMLFADQHEANVMIKANFVTILGYVAAVISTASFAPQAWKIIKSRETKDISVGMYLLTVLGFAAWLAFGLFQQQWPLVLSNSICFLLSGFILTMTLLPRREKAAVADAVEKAIDPIIPSNE